MADAHSQARDLSHRVQPRAAPGLQRLSGSTRRARGARHCKGRPDLAEQVHRLFTQKDPEANVSTGMIQFDLSLAKARVTDLERKGKDPKATPLEVEHAMIVVFKKNGISVPKSFMSVMKDFKPKDPQKQSDRPRHSSQKG